MIDANTVSRFVRSCATPRPYRFLDTLIKDTTPAPTCRKHAVSKVRHAYGAELWVCPECFPTEVSA